MEHSTSAALPYHHDHCELNLYHHHHLYKEEEGEEVEEEEDDEERRYTFPPFPIFSWERLGKLRGFGG